MEFEKNLGLLMKTARKEFGVTQDAMATDLGISLTMYSKLERGITSPSLQLLQELIDRMHLDPREIFYMKPQVDSDISAILSTLYTMDTEQIKIVRKIVAAIAK